MVTTYLTHLVALALATFFLSLILGLFFNKLTLPQQLYDYPNSRKLHSIPTPTTGGWVIIITLLINSTIFGLFKYEYYNYYFILCLVFFISGLLDDIFDWNYKIKFLSQLIGIAFLFILIPIDLSIITFSSIEIESHWINYILLSLWIIGIVNSFNFFDGINGLAGILAITFFTSYVLLIDASNSAFLLEICIIIIFATLGFLLFNKNPSRMFLGNSGSMLLGFLIATLPLIISANEGISINTTYPVIITAILLMEIIYLIYSRLKNKKNPFIADNLHLHHQLLKLNLKNQYVVVFIIVSNIIQSVLAYFSGHLQFYQLALIELFLFTLIIVGPRLYLTNCKKTI